MPSAEKLDLDAIRAYIHEWHSGWDVSDLHQSDRYLIALLAAVERVLAIPKIDPRETPKGLSGEDLASFMLECSWDNGHNAALDAIREALGVADA